MSNAARPEATVTGTATYRERIALPAGAVFEAIVRGGEIVMFVLCNFAQTDKSVAARRRGVGRQPLAQEGACAIELAHAFVCLALGECLAWLFLPPNFLQPQAPAFHRGAAALQLFGNVFRQFLKAAAAMEDG